MITADQIQKNWDNLLAIIKEYFPGARGTKLLTLYDFFGERMAMMPASSKEHHHNCFPGGYVDHVLRVIDFAIKHHELWKTMGITVNYTVEELVFTALNHDLGKIGTIYQDCYIPQESSWHRDRGELYTFNVKNPFGTVPDRSIFILQQAGIKMSENEYLGIKLHDGMYEDANRPYYMSNLPTSKLRTAMPYIIHHADMAAARIEYENWAKIKSPELINQEIEND